ncbi:hypothetical protein BTR22_04655 [Alkalihalophilus pseudofirmus]|uniref:S-layer homology domain-containing protein n=1 Tax=Alkalihalophilus pseudofirmus TaxID=79885 RepID=UPI0009532483|nr:hypothetical protein BTR22_04655 [Alkalihalophilus pseudofirmus]
MKKYPFSKQAVSFMLATALVVTPFSAMGPIGGTTVVEAAQVENLSKVINDKLAADGITNKTAITISQDIATIAYSTSAGDLENAINTFRTDNAAAFNAVFEGDVTTDDLIRFTTTFMSVAKEQLKDKSKEQIEAEVFDNGYYNFVKGLIAETLKDPNMKAIEDNMRKHIHIGFEDIFMMKSRLDTAAGITATEGRKVKEAFAIALFEATKSGSVPGSNATVKELADFLEVIYTKIPSEDKAVINNARTKIPNLTTANWNTVLGTVEVPDSVDPTPPDNGGGGTGPGPVDPDPVDPDPVDPDPIDPIPPRPGQTVDAGDSIVVERETTETGQVKAVTKVDGAKLAEVISAAPAADRVSLKVERAEGEVAELRLPKAAVEALEGAANKNLVVDIETDSGSVTIPVKELAAEKVRGMLDVAADADFEVSVFVNPASPQEAATVTAVLESDARGLKAKSEIVDFSMIVRSGDKSQNITRFSSYIHRELPVTDVTNPQNLVVYNVDAAPVAVPTQAGSDRVRFSSYEFSKYVVVEREPVAFPDLAANHWAKNAINTLSVRDILVGFENGEVRPARQTTRAEFAAIVTRALALPSAGEYSNEFSDVKGTEWFAKDLMPVVEAGIVHGRANGTYDPNAPITRQEAAAMVARATQFIELDEDKYDESVKVNQFTDANTIAPWAKSDVELAVQAGIIVGHANGTFDARGNTNRAQVASMINLLLEKADLK